MKSTEAQRLELIQEFMNRSQTRITNATPKYGDFDPQHDRRILSEKVIDKLLSAGGYLRLSELKYPHFSPKIQRIRAKMIFVYGMLKELKEEEMNHRA